MDKRDNVAIFTIQKNEEFNLPIWLEYYLRYFEPFDIYILDHQSTTPPTLMTLNWAYGQGVNIVSVENDEVFNHDWILNQIHSMQAKLLKEYDYVLFVDADEILISLEVPLDEFLKTLTNECYRAKGIEVLGYDKAYYNERYDKTLLSRVPLQWDYGCHKAIPLIEISPGLALIHLHKLDFEQAWHKNIRWSRLKWDQAAIDNNLSFQNQFHKYDTIDKFRELFNDTNGAPTFEFDARRELGIC